MNGDGDRTQLTAALHVVVDHLADSVVERVMELLELRLRQRDSGALAEQERRPPTKDPDQRPPRPPAASDLMTLREAAAYMNRPLESVRYWTHRLRLIPK